MDALCLVVDTNMIFRYVVRSTVYPRLYEVEWHHYLYWSVCGWLHTKNEQMLARAVISSVSVNLLWGFVCVAALVQSAQTMRMLSAHRFSYYLNVLENY